jgi:hypothetical protein
LDKKILYKIKDVRLMEFSKYKKIYRIGHDETIGVLEGNVYLQEKIDGGNFRFYVSENNKIIFGSRTQQLTSNECEDSNVAKNFKRVVEYIREQTKDIDLSNYKNYIFYGEACFKHTINYDWENMPLFLGFDVFDTNLNLFLYPEISKEIFRELNLKFVPGLGIKSNFNPELINDDLVPESVYALKSSIDKQAEGIVIKNYDKQIFAKYVRDKFKERNAEAFGGNPKYNKIDDTNNADFVFKYSTNPRIEKVIMKQINSGHKLDMKLMGIIINGTYQDIIEEEWLEILNSNWKLDFKNIRKLIAKRCIAVLNQMITNNAR